MTGWQSFHLWNNVCSMTYMLLALRRSSSMCNGAVRETRAGMRAMMGLELGLLLRSVVSMDLGLSFAAVPKWP